MKDLAFYLREADRVLPHLNLVQREEWARHCADTHPGFGRKVKPELEPIPAPEPVVAPIFPPFVPRETGAAEAIARQTQDRHEKLLAELAEIKQLRRLSVAWRAGILLCLLFLCAKAAHCQSTTTIRVTDMSTGVTVAPGDSVNKAIRVVCITGCSGGSGGGGTSSTFGAAFPTTGTAAGFIDSTGKMAGANLDASGFLKVNVAAGSGGNGAASNTGSAVPAQAGYTGINVGGTLRGVTGTNPSGVVYAMQVDGSAVTQPVSGTFWQTTQPVSAASLPLPTGAATAAKQPALGTAGTPSADVLTVQGATSMTPLKVDGSGSTQPISGTVTVNAGTNLNTSLLALETGGNLAKLPLAQASTTSGQSGPLVQGAVTTNAPSYTTAQTNPLSLDTSGLLRISLKDTPANTNKFLVTADPITFASPQAVTQSGTWNIGTVTAVTAISNALPAGTNVIGHVIVDSGSTSAVTIADGADVTLGAKADAKNTATDTTAITAMQVLKEISFMEQTPASRAVTNIGTFAVQATLTAETTKVIGVVRTADGSGNLLTSTGNALDVNLKTSAASNISTNIAQINGVTPLMGNGVTGTGSQRVTISSDNTAFSVNAIQSGTWTVQPGNTPNSTPWLTQDSPGTTGGLSTFVLEPAASDNHTVIKNGAGTVYHILAFNNSGTINYYRLYNAGTGFNGCNSATNLLWEGHIPANTADAGFVEDIEKGLAFSTGISICVTSSYGQTSTTNATATAISLNVGYK